MFKRLLVLVLFLAGLFWWLSSKDAPSKESQTADTEISAEETTTDTDSSDNTEEGTEPEEKTDTSSNTTKTNDAGKTDTTSATPAATTSTTNTQNTSNTGTQLNFASSAVPSRTTDVKVYLYEWGVDFSEKEIPSGTIRFNVQNNGRFTHDFNISGIRNFGKVAPRDNQRFAITLRPGEYSAISTRRDDLEQGMSQAFTVTR